MDCEECEDYYEDIIEELRGENSDLQQRIKDLEEAIEVLWYKV